MGLIRKHDLEVREEANGIATTIVNHKSNGSAMLTVFDAKFPAGAEAAAHACTNAEESVLVLAGEFKFTRNGDELMVPAGDCVHFPAGAVRSYANVGGGEGRLLFFSPHPEPKMEFKPHPDAAEGRGDAGVFRRGEPYEFLPGVMRHDVTSADIGAESSFMSDMVISPGGEIPVHYHPEHDESIYCLEGDIVFTYGDDRNLKGAGGDVFLGELKIPHGIRNESSGPARVLAIHPTTEPKRVFVD